MGEEEKEKNKETKLYDIAQTSVRIFVFLFVAILGLYLIGFTELKEMISLLGAASLYGASLFAATIEKLD